MPGEAESFEPAGHLLSGGRSLAELLQYAEKHAGAGGDGGGGAAAEGGGDAAPAPDSPSAPAARDAPPPHRAALAPAASVDDALASVRFSLDHGVFAGKSALGARELDALRAWLGLLARAMPGGAAARASIGALLARLPPPSDNATLTSREWDGWLGAWRLGGARAPRAWNEAVAWSGGCAWAGGGGDGYTCGLWTLLHALSLGAPAAGLRPSRAADAARGFVAEFF